MSGWVSRMSWRILRCASSEKSARAAARRRAAQRTISVIHARHEVTRPGRLYIARVMHAEQHHAMSMRFQQSLLSKQHTLHPAERKEKFVNQQDGERSLAHQV
jgi:hypothetical protein